jgi:hypothetical protein
MRVRLHSKRRYEQENPNVYMFVAHTVHKPEWFWYISDVLV